MLGRDAIAFSQPALLRSALIAHCHNKIIVPIGSYPHEEGKIRVEYHMGYVLVPARYLGPICVFHTLTLRKPAPQNIERVATERQTTSDSLLMMLYLVSVPIYPYEERKTRVEYHMGLHIYVTVFRVVPFPRPCARHHRIFLNNPTVWVHTERAPASSGMVSTSDGRIIGCPSHLCNSTLDAEMNQVL